MPAKILVSYDIVTPESAEQGDYAESGWDNEEGVEVEPDDYDREDGLTRVDLAVKMLKYEGATEPSSSHYHKGVWYTEPDGSTNYRTGEVKTRSFRLEGFTEPEQEMIFNQLKRKPATVR